MSILTWTYIIVGITFSIYIGIAIASRVADTKSFYVAGGDVPPVLNGMATGADWMSAASFISMAGIISFWGFRGMVLLLGWTGGYVLLAILLAPFLRKFGQYTVPDFIGSRYYSDFARLVAALCAIFVSFTYVVGQMRGVGIVFSRFLNVDILTGIVIGMAILMAYATLGGMKGITYTQVAQYSVLILAYLIPAFAISGMITGNPIPQIGFGGTIADGRTLLGALDEINRDLGFQAYTATFETWNMMNTFLFTLALMVGTAGLPHVIIRFYTVPSVAGARWSAVWALLFIGLLYTAAPAVASFARYNMIRSLNEKSMDDLKKDAAAANMAKHWFFTWQATGLLKWEDLNGDGKIQYRAGKATAGKINFDTNKEHGNVANGIPMAKNELYVDRDIMVLANPEIAQLPNWIIALVAAGGLAAALSTAAGLLLVISSSVSHDFYAKLINPEASDAKRLMVARFVVAVSILIAGYFGYNPPGFVAQLVAFAFGLAAASFFPAIVMGVFSKKTTSQAAIAGMVVGISFTAYYIIQAKFFGGSNFFFGIIPEAIGSVGMLFNFVCCIVISKFTPEPPEDVQELVESIRYPQGAAAATASH